MADKAYLQWNIVNWVTVVLMATVAMLIVGAIGSSVRVWRGQADGSTD